MNSNLYVIIEKNYQIYNVKIHDLLNIHFKQLSNYKEFFLHEALTFIQTNINSNIKIILYFHNLTHFSKEIIKYLNTLSNIKCDIYLFTFDWWIRPRSLNTEFIANIFKTTTYKVITFANDINQLNYFHNYNYEIYINNIIYCNIWSCYNSSICIFNKTPFNKILLSGSKSGKSYPERNKIYTMNNVVYHIKQISEINQTHCHNINDYSKKLNEYLCCFTSSVSVLNLSESYNNNKIYINTHTILQKVFEILASGSLLLYPLHEAEYIKKIGLYHNKNCYLLDFNKNLQSQINKLLSKKFHKKVNKIRYNGYIHATTNLTSINKFNELHNIIVNN
jgi:hypothetical protein